VFHFYIAIDLSYFHLEQEGVQKEKLEDIIRELKGEIKALNEKVLKVEQGIHPHDVKGKIQELENSVASERRKNMVNNHMLNYLTHEIKTLQEELDETRKMYEDCENEMNEMKTKAQAADDDRKRIKDLEAEVQQLRDKNKELAEKLATKGRWTSRNLVKQMQ
jgi:chromosome segregation ATPase